MRKVRINDFLSEIKEIEEPITNSNLEEVKKIYLSCEIDRLKTKYTLIKIITYLLELIDILVLICMFMLNIDKKVLILIVITFILNLVIGVLLGISPDYKYEIEKKENELNNR